MNIELFQHKEREIFSNAACDTLADAFCYDFGGYCIDAPHYIPIGSTMRVDRRNAAYQPFATPRMTVR